MADFSHIQGVQTVVKESGKTMQQLRVAGSAKLSITCPGLSVAENMADLVDGYCRLVNNSNTSIWNRKGRFKCSLNCKIIAPLKALNNSS